MLTAHDAATTNSRKVQKRWGKLVNHGWHAERTACLNQPSGTAHSLGLDDTLGFGGGGSDAKIFAKARYRSLQVCFFPMV